MSYHSRIVSTIILSVALLSLTVTHTPLSSAQNQQRPRLVESNSRPKPAVKPTPPVAEADVDADVIRVDTDLVNTVFTAVDQDRHFVTTLRAQDLRVLENQTPQDISLFERETNRPLTIVILVDTSKSQERTLPDEKKAAKAFLRAVMRPAIDKVAIVSFTGAPTVQQDLTESFPKLERAIDRLKVELPADNPTCEDLKTPQEDPLCWTSIWDSVWASANEVLAKAPENSRRAIVLLSDGDDTASTIKRQVSIDSAVRNNVSVYSIGIGDPEAYKIEKDSLEKLSNRTGGRAFFPASELELQRAFTQIQEELRSQYVVAYSPKNKTRDGARREVKLEIVNPELRKQKLQLLYRQNYYAPKQ
ncbi:MAG TPA: VWA domain-containing protein [Pyrinomonadaceae bacterium]|nr:VWA domain-containing protein [Pyrinomonadaceae bacterium]